MNYFHLANVTGTGKETGYVGHGASAAVNAGVVTVMALSPTNDLVVGGTYTITGPAGSHISYNTTCATVAGALATFDIV
ncbi:hypothetical protein N825_27650 [Skermanella stibiiresistens SB22]|uniref:Uncharacterized protein n=1 Tax=Skermanella stibiiresistens SB22 TaxID=1385369 RepID=W9H9W0_9PROT|nr:hypothetical protein [Skermanella stibiiresistens]EWY41497.1 hypothetical protein N825_27650 [Skermanella stibiiresistens SB22]